MRQSPEWSGRSTYGCRVSDPPELPLAYRHGHVFYDVMPDSKPMTWSIWDIEGWIGDIHLGEQWSSTVKAGVERGPFATWQSAIAGLLDSRSDMNLE